MTGAVLRQVKSRRPFERAARTACFDVCLLVVAPFIGAQYRYFNNLNIYS